MALTVTQLARACGLSRSTGNYRVYGEKDLERLRQVCVYRDAGLKLSDIRSILDRPHSDAASVLERRMVEIEYEIGRMRDHQRTIARLLKDTGRLRRLRMVTKEKWTEIMRAPGFSEDDIHRWHAEFERNAPAEHQEFLEFLHIPKDEVTHIREWSAQWTAPQ